MSDIIIDLKNHVEPLLKKINRLKEHIKVVDAQQMMRGELQHLETLQKQHTSKQERSSQ